MKRQAVARLAAFAVVAAVAAVLIGKWMVRRAEVAANRAELHRLGLPGDGTREFVPLPSILPHHAPAARIGGELFADKRLARTSRRTCASCHWMNMGGSDGKLHNGVLTRPIVNAAATTVFFHDGSVKSFAEAATKMLTDGNYAGGGSLDDITKRIAADTDLSAAFQRAYAQGLTTTNLVDSLEQYARTLLSAGRTFDRFQGGDEHVLQPLEKAGYEIFRARKCISCHSGPVLGGLRVHEGRKVTQLRGIGQRRVFFADGASRSLDTAIARMPSGGDEWTAEERAALVAFLKTL